jgi:hypothetical protein
MASHLIRKQTPEERELAKKRKELAEIEARLILHELELSTLQSELQVFEARYIRVVGTRYAELDEIEARIADAEAHNRPHDQEAQAKATNARERSGESAHATEDIPVLDQRPFVPSDNLKSLFREVVKRVHPDLTTDEAERARRQVLMAEANHAYSVGNEAELRALLTDAEASPDAVVGDGVGAELVRVIRKIAQVEDRLERIGTEIEDMQKTDLWGLRLKAESIEKEGRDLFAEMAAGVDIRIAATLERLARVISQAGL